MSISQNFPAISPTLNLNFARSKKLDPRITFTRSSSATRTNAQGLIEVVGTDTPRFEHSVVGVGSTVTSVQSLGLLIEASRTNLITYSEQFDNAAWTKSYLGITTNTSATTAPDGSTNTDALLETAATDEHRIRQTFTGLTTNTNYTTSVYVKDLGGRNLGIRIIDTDNTSNGYFAIFSPSAGNIVISHSSLGAGIATSSTITNVGNGWYRATLTGNAGVSCTKYILDLFCYSDTSFNYAGDITKGLYLWGAQLEAGSFATSYIPTVASTVTRSADNASMTGTNFSSWYNSTEGTLFAQAAPSTSAAYSGYLYSIGSDFNNSITAYRQSDYQPVVRIRSSSSDVYGALGFGAIWTTNTVRKVGLTFKTNSFNSAVSGTVSSDVTSGTLPSYSNLSLGSLSNGNYLNGTISQLLYYPKRLTNAQLQNLTK
jgi:hypothetical protein